MIFTSLASGSSGNCTFVASEHTNILIDCGISAKRIDESLRALGRSLSMIDGILLTHEHADHIKGLKRLMSGYGIPVYASEGTLKGVANVTKDEYFRYGGKALMERISADQTIEIGDMRITPFSVSHDAAMPFAYRMEMRQESFDKEAFLLGDGRLPESFDVLAEEKRKHVSACVMTDTGFFDDAIRDHMYGLDVLLLEANHDRSMLVNGPYPLRLKRRIMSRQGHLCNNAAGQLISEIIGPKLSHVFLGHLSRENNTPERALETVRTELQKAHGERIAEALSLSVVPPDGMSEVIKL